MLSFYGDFLKIQVLCATMFGKVPLFFHKGKFFENMVVINQCDSENHENGGFFNFYEKGLSRSRNRGIELSNADICLISDNDVYFNDNTIDIIIKSFLDYPEADILTFQVQTPDGEPYKKYKNNFFWHTKITLAKVSSVEIAFRRENIIKNNIKFDENFGLGSTFPTSEEYIFLSDALDKGLKIGFIPEVIVYHPKESSGGNFNNLDLVSAKGAMISRIFGKKGFFICFLFALRKYRYSGMSFFKFFNIMISGFLKHQKQT